MSAPERACFKYKLLKIHIYIYIYIDAWAINMQSGCVHVLDYLDRRVYSHSLGQLFASFRTKLFAVLIIKAAERVVQQVKQHNVIPKMSATKVVFLVFFARGGLEKATLR